MFQCRKRRSDLISISARLLASGESGEQFGFFSKLLTHTNIPADVCPVVLPHPPLAPALTSETLQPLLFAFLTDDEEQRNAHGDQNHRGANGEEFLHVVILF